MADLSSAKIFGIADSKTGCYPWIPWGIVKIGIDQNPD